VVPIVPVYSQHSFVEPGQVPRFKLRVYHRHYILKCA
jgi:hypothetical protein